MPEKKDHFKKLEIILKAKGIDCDRSGESPIFTSGKKKFMPNTGPNTDLLASEPAKLAALIQSKLGLNKRVFARKGAVRKISKETAEHFFDTYHLMNSTQSAFNFGLFLDGELLAAAAFSKGRKMNRLPEDKRSFELIRYCCKDGITVAGGLTKLVMNFCREKNAGDVMTYVDKQFSEGASFVKAGFVKHSETERNVKLIYTPEGL